MDRIDFTKSINANISIEQVVVNYFDEIMGIYNVLGEYSNFKLKGTFGEDGVSFELRFRKKKDAETLYDSIKSLKSIEIYDRQFNWNFEHNGKVILVNLV